MTMTAKYPGTCTRCGERFASGTQIEWVRGAGANHATCPTKSAPAGIMSREEAISRLVDRDVKRWGESEREASTEHWSKYSHGSALNALAVADVNNIDRGMVKIAKSIMTAADRRKLSEGG